MNKISGINWEEKMNLWDEIITEVRDEIKKDRIKERGVEKNDRKKSTG